MRQKELEDILELAADTAVDIVLAELDCWKSDADYEQRRAYCRRRLAEFMCREVLE